MPKMHRQEYISYSTSGELYPKTLANLRKKHQVEPIVFGLIVRAGKIVTFDIPKNESKEARLAQLLDAPIADPYGNTDILTAIHRRFPNIIGDGVLIGDSAYFGAHQGRGDKPSRLVVPVRHEIDETVDLDDFLELVHPRAEFHLRTGEEALDILQQENLPFGRQRRQMTAAAITSLLEPPQAA